MKDETWGDGYEAGERRGKEKDRFRPLLERCELVLCEAADRMMVCRRGTPAAGIAFDEEGNARDLVADLRRELELLERK